MPGARWDRTWSSASCCPSQRHGRASTSCSARWTSAATSARERPYTLVNFVATVDGRATLQRSLGRARRRRRPGDVPRPARAGRRRAGRHRRRCGPSATAGSSASPSAASGAHAARPARPSRWPAWSPAAATSRPTSRCSPSPRPGSCLLADRRSTSTTARAQVEVVRLDPGELTLTTAMRAAAHPTTASRRCCARAARRCSARCCTRASSTSCS